MLNSCKPVSNHEKWEISRNHPQKYELNYAWKSRLYGVIIEDENLSEWFLKNVAQFNSVL